MELPLPCLLCSNAEVERRGATGRASVPYPCEDTGISVSTCSVKGAQDTKTASKLWNCPHKLLQEKTVRTKLLVDRFMKILMNTSTYSTQKVSRGKHFQMIKKKKNQVAFEKEVFICISTIPTNTPHSPLIINFGYS